MSIFFVEKKIIFFIKNIVTFTFSVWQHWREWRSLGEKKNWNYSRTHIICICVPFMKVLARKKNNPLSRIHCFDHLWHNQLPANYLLHNLWNCIQQYYFFFFPFSVHLQYYVLWIRWELNIVWDWPNLQYMFICTTVKENDRYI